MLRVTPPTSSVGVVVSVIKSVLVSLAPSIMMIACAIDAVSANARLVSQAINFVFMPGSPFDALSVYYTESFNCWKKSKNHTGSDNCLMHSEYRNLVYAENRTTVKIPDIAPCIPDYSTAERKFRYYRGAHFYCVEVLCVHIRKWLSFVFRTNCSNWEFGWRMKIYITHYSQSVY